MHKLRDVDAVCEIPAWTGHGWYTDVRAQKVKDCPDTPEGVYDEDCPELEKVGVRYLTEEEMEGES